MPIVTPCGQGSSGTLSSVYLGTSDSVGTPQTATISASYSATVT